MKKNIKLDQILLIFNEIKQLFKPTSEMMKLFELIIQIIQTSGSQISLNRSIQAKIEAHEIKKLYNYI